MAARHWAIMVTGTIERRRTAAVPSRRRQTVLARLRRDWLMLLLVAPGLAALVVFHYIPLAGYVIAFQEYLPFVGFTDSPWVGLANFSALFASQAFWHSVANTLEIALLQLVFYFPAPIALALALNSLLSGKIRRFVQSVVYLPHFIGWVIIVSLFQQMLGGGGVVPSLLREAGLPAFNMMTSPPAFKWLMTLEVIWKDTGWGTIIYLAALMTIDQNLYEAAAVDGAGRWRRVWHVTLPGIMPITILLLILRLGHALSVGFEQILLQRDNVGPTAGEVLDTYVYFHGIQGGEWGPAAAAGLIKGLVGTALVLGANKLAHLFDQPGIYQ